MVKKVIDIIPPEKYPAKAPAPAQSAQSIPAFPEDSLPAPEILIEGERRESKPKLTYFTGPRPGSFKPEKSEGSGIFKDWFWKLVIVASVIIAVMYVIDMNVARAVIRIWPETSPLAEETTVIVDTGAKVVDAGKNTVPGLMVMFDDAVKGESIVTTMKDSQGRAQGMVKIFNNYTSAQPLVKNTRLQAPLEKFQPALNKDEAPWFRTAESVVIEPKSSVTVKVVADGAGEKYNIEPSVFSVPGLAGTPKYTFIYAQSFEKFDGGSQGTSPEVAQADIDNAKTAIAEQANAEIKNRLAAQVPQGFVLLEDTVKIELEAPVISAKIGDAIAKIPCEVRGKASAVAYRKADAESLGKDFIIGKIPEGGRSDEKSLEIKLTPAGIDSTSNKPVLAVSANVSFYRLMDDSDLKKGLSEKSADAALMFLTNQPGMKDAKIQLSPPWRFNIPRDLDRIDIQTILE